MAIQLAAPYLRRELAEQAAVAAIAAMREPTEAMAFQGHFEMPDYDPEDADAANVWRAMIDAALSDV